MSGGGPSKTSTAAPGSDNPRFSVFDETDMEAADVLMSLRKTRTPLPTARPRTALDAPVAVQDDHERRVEEMLREKDAAREAQGKGPLEERSRAEYRTGLHTQVYGVEAGPRDRCVQCRAAEGKTRGDAVVGKFFPAVHCMSKEGGKGTCSRCKVLKQKCVRDE